MILSVHQPQYLPWLGYFDKIALSNGFVFLDQVQYKHREFQNRNKIKTKQGWVWLTVPVITKGDHEQLINEVLIDNTLRWQKKHWRAIQLNYSKSAYFKDYVSFFEDLYCNKTWEKLIDLNLHVIRFLLECLDITTKTHLESEIGTSSKSTERIIELCKKLKVDTYLSGSGGRHYLDQSQFEQANIKLSYQDYKHPVYQQCFDDFLPNMTAIDLLFNHGSESRKILLNSKH